MAGNLFQISRVYKAEETGIRVAVITTAAFVSGIISGLLAYGTSFLDGQHGIKGWRYLFIVEGAPSAFLGILSYFLLFDDTNKVSWLTEQQKQWQRMRIQYNDDHHRVSWADVLAAWRSWKTWVFSVLLFLNAESMICLSVFEPTLIHAFGFSVLNSQALSAPPYLVGAVMVVPAGYLADRYHCRVFLTALGFALLSLGYVLLLVLNDTWCKSCFVPSFLPVRYNGSRIY